MRHSTGFIKRSAIALLALATLAGCPSSRDQVDADKFALPEHSMNNTIGNKGFDGAASTETGARPGADTPQGILSATHKYREVKKEKEAKESQAKAEKLKQAAEERRKAEEAAKKAEEEAEKRRLEEQRKKAEEEAKRLKEWRPDDYVAQFKDIAFPATYDKGIVEVPDKTLNNLRNFQTKALEEINNARKQLGMDKLSEDVGLNAYALVRANEVLANPVANKDTRPDGKALSEYFKGDIAEEILVDTPDGALDSFGQKLVANPKAQVLTKAEAKKAGIGVAAKRGSYWTAVEVGSANATWPAYEIKKK